MNPRRLSLFSAVFSILLAATLGILAIPSVGAQPPVADFQPTYTTSQAAARVAAAQATEHATRNAQVAAMPDVSTVYFPLTGHHVSNRNGFLDYWRRNGQVPVFGYPITEEIVENGHVVQYFERARLEFHPEHFGTSWQVQPGRLSTEVIPGLNQDQVADPYQPGVRYFPETGHTLAGAFRWYWEQHGGMRIFGYPLSEPYYESNGLLVQYFERARMEHHPENAGTFYEVLVSDLGRQAARTSGYSLAPVAQLAGTVTWSSALWARHVEVNLSTQWLTAFEGNVPVFSAPVTTGKDGYNTPTGRFAIYDKLPAQDMRGSAGGETWYVPGVPWVMYIYGGVALHGTYWHNLFGTGYRVSHGCINMRIEDARWLYNWSSVGTPVYVYY